MKLSMIIDRLIDLDIRIMVRDEGIRLQGPEENITDEIINEVRMNKEALLQYFRETDARRQLAGSIPPAEPADSYPLSSSQRRLWILSQFKNAGVAYNMPGVYVLEGKLDKGALERALSALIARHEILRTVFNEDSQGTIRQFVRAPEDVVFEVDHHDISNEEDPEGQLKVLIRKAVAKTFDLSSAPLLQAGLYRIDKDRWIFCYVMHHIVSDAWSTSVLIKELLTLYNACLQEKPAPLKPLRIQYKDYAGWQQQYLNGNLLEEHERYWLRQFEGELHRLDLPADKPRPLIKTYNGKAVYKTFSRDTVRGLKAYLDEQGATLFMGLLAGLNALLYRYTQQKDIIVGSPIANREHPGLEDQIGFYVNTLALRTRFSEGDNFQQLLQRVREVTLDAYKYQTYPFDELVDKLRLNPDLSRSALFDVMLVLQDDGDRFNELHAKNMIIREYEGEIHFSSKFDLYLYFAKTAGQLDLRINYNTDIYKEDTVFRFADHLEQLLAAMLKRESTPVSQVNYLSPTEERCILARFNKPIEDQLDDKTIIGLFEEQARQFPDRIAIATEKEAVLTYDQLNKKANQLAGYLRSNYQIKANDRIGIRLGRSFWMMISILGALKSGAAYVPVDPDWPRPRADYILSDSGCKVVIDDEMLAKFQEEEDLHDTTNPVPIHSENDLIYVIYTSGSTGKPKGVMVEHRNVTALLPNLVARFGLQPDITLGATTNYTFDISVLELLCPLAVGGALNLVTNPDPAYILELIRDNKIDALQCTPSRLIQILELSNGAVDKLGCLKTLLVGGEDLGEHLYAKLNTLASTRVINVYGPTETTVWSTALDIHKSRVLSIGTPLLNESIYIMDHNRGLVPIGITGEICIGGAGVTRGYLNLPGLTSEKFVPDPFREGDSMYMYRTGDLARWLPDGSIEYIGRMDDQIKIRGYRIELGEIENALMIHEGIERAVVLAGTDADGEKYLTAYLTGTTDLDISEIRSHLMKSLPAYMVPDQYVQLEELPLNSNGKVDKKRLPVQKSISRSVTAYIVPRNEIEEKLTLIWQEVLNRDMIGVRDNFFELGGHSLKLMRLFSKISEQFQIKLSIEVFFNNATIESSAKYIEALRGLQEGIPTTTDELIL